MPRTIQIQDVPDDVYAGLVRRAAASGVTVPELLRQAAIKLATRPSMTEWLEGVRAHPTSDVTTAEVLEALDEIRGPWPDAGP